MTTENRLAKSETQTRPKMSAQDWADRGNRILDGQEPMTCKKHAGQFMRRDDVRWVVRDGRCVIERIA
jgi:hypothetical protein